MDACNITRIMQYYEDAILGNAILETALLEVATLEDAILEDAILEDAILEDAMRIMLEDAILGGCDISEMQC